MSSSLDSSDLSWDPSDLVTQLAQNVPGLDAERTIAALEERLIEGLGAPVQQTLDELGLRRFPDEAPSELPIPELPVDQEGD